MAVIVYLIGLVVLTRRVVHQHHIVGEQASVSVFLQESHRGMVLHFHRIALGITTNEVKLSRRHAQIERQHAIDGLQLFYLLGLDICSTLTLHITQLQTKLTEFLRNQAGHAGSIVAAVGLWHHILRHQAIFHGQICHATEGATIAQWVLEEPAYHLVIDGLI